MISEQAYALCMAIEELPASEKQTQISVMAADLRAKIAEVEGELVEVRSRNSMLAVQRADAVHLAKANPTQAYQRIQQLKDRAEAAEAKCRELESRCKKAEWQWADCKKAFELQTRIRDNYQKKFEELEARLAARDAADAELAERLERTADPGRADIRVHPSGGIEMKGSNSVYRPKPGTVCLISPPNSDDDNGYTFGEFEVLWEDETFIFYRKPGCWPSVDKWDHVICKPND